MRKLLCVPAALGLLLLVACPVWAGEAKAASPDEKAQAERAKALVEAFNRGDARALAEFWTPDGDYMDELGHHYKGRKAIEEDKKQRLKANPDMKPDDVKDNASYLDSLGWVLFKEKKYKEALGPLEQALKDPDAQSIEIYDHLADVHMALGERDLAIKA